MNYKNTILVALFTLLSVTCGFAQKGSDANMIGHIISKKTGVHIPFSTVKIKNTMLGVQADATGHFQMFHITPGTYIVEASYMGYQPLEKEITFVADKTIEINFELEDMPRVMGEVVVSANRGESNQVESATIVNVMTPKQFETTTSCSMADALQYQTGLRVEYNCNNCGYPQLKINGLDGQYSQTLIDSRPIFSSLAAVYGLEQLPTDMIDRVEVIRGGGSALFGSNAIAGVVNIITKEPMRSTASISNTSQMIGTSAYDINTALNASLVSSNNKAGVYIFGVNRQRSAYDRNGDSFSDIPELKNTTVGFRGYYKTSMYSKITLEYHHVDEFRRGGNKLDLPVHEADIAEQLQHRIDAASLRFDYFSKNAKHLFSIYSSLQNTNRESYFGAEQDPNAYGNTNDIIVSSGGMYKFRMKKCLFLPAELTAGVEYNYNKTHDIMLGYDRNLLQEVHVLGSYAQNEWKNDKWTFLLGFRLDKHNMVKNLVFSPRANLRYMPTKWLVTRLSYASGFRAPQTYDEDLHVSAVGGEMALIELDPNLKEEKSHSISGSLDFIKNFGEVQTKLLIEGFYTNLNNVFVLTENGTDADGNLLMLRENAKGAYVGGLNIAGKLVYRDMIDFEIGYTYQQSRYKEDFEWSPEVAPQKKMYRAPDHYGYLTLTYSPIHDLDISLTGIYTGKMLVQHFAGYIAKDTEVITNPFFDMGLKVAYEFGLGKLKTTKLQVNAGVKNIFDSYQKDLDVGIDKDAGYFYGPLLPRTCFIGLKFSL